MPGARTGPSSLASEVTGHSSAGGARPAADVNRRREPFVYATGVSDQGSPGTTVSFARFFFCQEL